MCFPFQFCAISKKNEEKEESETKYDRYRSVEWLSYFAIILPLNLGLAFFSTGYPLYLVKNRPELAKGTLNLPENSSVNSGSPISSNLSYRATHKISLVQVIAVKPG